MRDLATGGMTMIVVTDEMDFARLSVAWISPLLRGDIEHGRTCSVITRN